MKWKHCVKITLINELEIRFNMAMFKSLYTQIEDSFTPANRNDNRWRLPVQNFHPNKLLERVYLNCLFSSSPYS